MSRILIVEDEEAIADLEKDYLELSQFDVKVENTGDAGLATALAEDFDLIILDLMLPKMNGLDACMKIREFSTVPVIMLTARGDDMDKIIGFEYGADDYITKPFNILELKARVRALLRRASLSKDQESSEKLTIGNISIDYQKHSAVKDGALIELTGREFELLELFMKNPGRVYSRENLLNIVWGHDYQGDVRTVDVHVHRLRDKLEANPASPEYIITKWGVGYYFKG